MESLAINQQLAAFYSRKRVLITGHTGFKGAWLARWLQLLGADVAGLALDPGYSPNLFDLVGLQCGMESHIGDIRDAELVARVTAAFQPDIVLHLAAQPLVRLSYREPLLTFGSNVMGTAHVLEACRLTSSVRAIVVVTSDKCYENREWYWGYRESDPMGGADPYSASKGCTELVTSSYRRSYFSREDSAGLASARAGNVIGGGDWSEDRLVPDMIRGIASDQEILIRNPRSTRPWQHVLEPVAGYLQLAMRLHAEPTAFADGWNFGPDDADTLEVKELARRFIQAIGRGRLALGEADASSPHEAKLLSLDCRKARQLLGWRPRLNSDRCIQLTADWYQAHLLEPGSERAVLDRQIHHYESLLV